MRQDLRESGGGIFLPTFVRMRMVTFWSLTVLGCLLVRPAASNATGNIFKAAHGNLCLDESGSVAGDSTSISTCEGTSTGRTHPPSTDDPLSFTLSESTSRRPC